MAPTSLDAPEYDAESIFAPPPPHRVKGRGCVFTPRTRNWLLIAVAAIAVAVATLCAVYM
jgi:hypothetical protein